MILALKITGIVLASLIVLFVIVEQVAAAVMRSRTFGAEEIDVTVAEGTVEYHEPEGETPYLCKKLADGSDADAFKIISVGDMHLHDDLADFSLEVLSRFIEKEKPDLVVLLGDNVVGRYDTVLHEKVKKFFEDRHQYWAFVLGNHDGEGYQGQGHERIESRRWAYEALAGSPYCVTRNEDAGYGFGNCVVNVKCGTKILQSLFFLDSDQYMTEELCAEYGFEYQNGCAFLRKEQVDWYKKRLAEVTEENGGETPKSLMYFHIALQEFQEAYDKLQKKSDEVKRLYGDVWEKIDGSCYSTGMFQAILDGNSTQAVIVGHDHINGIAMEYKGVKLLYTQGLQWDMAYNRRKNNHFLSIWYTIDKNACFYIEGVTATVIRADGKADFMPKYAQFEGVLEGFEKEIEICSFGVKNTYKDKK